MNRTSRLSALTLALLLPAGAVTAQSAPEIIDRQIAEMRAGDFEAAFAHASDQLRMIFRTPENFARMVQQGYPMVIDPAEVRYLDRGERAGIEVQRVLILDREGRSFLLEYQLTGDEGARRISGVSILPETGAGV